MSNWTHPICEPCWDRESPNRAPLRITEKYRQQERCCWCGLSTRAGIYVRHNPRALAFHTEEHPD